MLPAVEEVTDLSKMVSRARCALARAKCRQGRQMEFRLPFGALVMRPNLDGSGGAVLRREARSALIWQKLLMDVPPIVEEVDRPDSEIWSDLCVSRASVGRPPDRRP